MSNDEDLYPRLNSALRCRGVPTLRPNSIRFNHPALLLWIIRDGIASDDSQGTTWEQICRLFHLSGGPFATGNLRVFRTLDSLIKAGFLQFILTDAKESPASIVPDADQVNLGWYSVTEQWMEIQSKLDLSLFSLVELALESSCILYPLFGGVNRHAEGPDVYVIMPFSRSMTAVYAEHIQKTIVRCGLRCVRGDEQLGTHAIMQDIWNGLGNSRLVVADCTGSNPNVFYEIGIAHTLGKPVILLTQDSTDVPFDVQHIRHIQYQNNADGLRELELSLRNAIRAELLDA